MSRESLGSVVLDADDGKVELSAEVIPGEEDLFLFFFGKSYTLGLNETELRKLKAFLDGMICWDVDAAGGGNA